MSERIRRIAVIGGSRIPFCRSNTVYANKTNLDMLAAEGVRFAKHFGQSAPCSPGRASLYTGLYAMNHR